MPRALPTQRLPSRSSKSADTAPRGRPSRAASADTPAALTRSSSPAAVPTQTFDPRSLTIASACTLASAAGTPAVVISVPVQRTTPLSVPIHSFLVVARQQAVDLAIRQPLARCARAASPRRLTSPASRVPSQTSPVRRVGDRDHDRGRQGRGKRQGLEPSAAIAHRAAAHRREEQPPVATTDHRGHERVRQRVSDVTDVNAPSR